MSNDKQQIAERATERTHAYSQPTINGKSVHNRQQEQFVRVQTTPVEPIWQNSTSYDLDDFATRSTITRYVNGNNGISDTPTMDLLNPASFMATSKAAEQWRKSWRDRQYAEAGPAENVSRGQASVPMPLTPMHQRLVRMRAIQKDDKKSQSKRSAKLGTWITIFLMICLIIGLGTFVIVSYMPGSPFGVSSVTPPPNTKQPTLVLVGTTSQTITVGRLFNFKENNLASTRLLSSYETQLLRSSIRAVTTFQFLLIIKEHSMSPFLLIATGQLALTE